MVAKDIFDFNFSARGLVQAIVSAFESGLFKRSVSPFIVKSGIDGFNLLISNNFGFGQIHERMKWIWCLNIRMKIEVSSMKKS